MSKQISGVYKIESKKKSYRVYIGSSINIFKRWHDHLFALRNNKHYSKKLQRHFNKYGENDLIFSILLGCEKEDLIKIEQYFIDAYNPYFNSCPTAGNQLGVKASPETILKLKISHTGIKDSEETKRRKSEAGKKKVFTPEHRANLSKANIGKTKPPLTEEQSKRLSEAVTQAWVRRKQKQQDKKNIA